MKLQTLITGLFLVLNLTSNFAQEIFFDCGNFPEDFQATSITANKEMVAEIPFSKFDQTFQFNCKYFTINRQNDPTNINKKSIGLHSTMETQEDAKIKIIKPNAEAPDWKQTEVEYLCFTDHTLDYLFESRNC